jgi:hypothetical protein
MPSDDIPDDPFDFKVPAFENFTGPHAEEIKTFVKDFAAAKFDYSALLHQQSFRELRIAIWALDEEQVRNTLLRAIATSIYLHMKDHMSDDPERFIRWVEAQ